CFRQRPSFQSCSVRPHYPWQALKYQSNENATNSSLYLKQLSRNDSAPVSCHRAEILVRADGGFRASASAEPPSASPGKLRPWFVKQSCYCSGRYASRSARTSWFAAKIGYGSLFKIRGTLGTKGWCRFDSQAKSCLCS